MKTVALRVEGLFPIDIMSPKVYINDKGESVYFSWFYDSKSFTYKVNHYVNGKIFKVFEDASYKGSVRIFSSLCEFSHQ